MSVKMARDTEHVSYEENLRELYFFCLAKETLKGDQVAACDYMKGNYRDKVRLLLAVAENIATCVVTWDIQM